MSGSERDKPSNSRPLGGRRRLALDCLAWVSFAVGLIGMFVVVFLALIGEGDGAFRTWETTRKQANIFLGCGALAVGIPAAVWLLQKWLDRDITSKKPAERGDPLEW